MCSLAAAMLTITAVAALAQEPPAVVSATAEEPSAVSSTTEDPPTAPSTAVRAPEPASLDELLDLVKTGFRREREANQVRVARFIQAKAEQAKLVQEIRNRVAAEEARSQRLETAFSANETALAQLEDNLEQRLGTMGELFGVVRQVAGDMQAHVWESVTSSQIPDREKLLEKLGRGKELPKTDDLEKLWFELQREMTQQGKIVRYPATVLTTDGDEEQREVVRAGVFSVVSEGRYLVWDTDIQKIRELNRQPPTRYLQTVAPYQANTGADFAVLAIDPSRGSLLMALIDTPSQAERIQQGGAVGYAIIVIGVFALAVGFMKLVTLSITSHKVKAQRGRDEASSNNPLGRVLKTYEKNPTLDPEALELRLDQAVLEEADRLDRFMWLVRVVSVVAPLMGLLGTVTGMIQTFQSITMFGAGDPKMMAGGISEALVTTMLGLMTAAPLVLLYAFLSTSRKRILSILMGQSAGLVAIRIEESSANA
ncbi:MAG: MotA/TolQ/ExbB proton channel family protein [Deltaproteobacteria bacterium]|nr:MotA/TolQ/ExbB proton channel family protein [Deltaproteobacteria bacterium]